MGASASRPLSAFWRLKRRKSVTSFNVQRRLLYIYLRLQMALLHVEKNGDKLGLWLVVGYGGADSGRWDDASVV